VDGDAYRYEGNPPSLVLDSGAKAHVVYYKAGASQDLMYATNATGTWVVSTIDAAGMVGPNPALAIDHNDHLHVSYLDATNSKLKYATSKGVVPGNGNCSPGSNWDCEVVGPGSGDTALAVDSAGWVHLAYVYGNLSYAKRDPATKTWAISPVASTGSWQLKIDEMAIALDSGGKAHVVYSLVDHRPDGTPYEADLFYIVEK
jgi:hypothetical protein